MQSVPWWRGAVIYQIYIRSFADGNEDRQGDFAGLISKLDYLASLGIDAIWLSPIHPSPDRDWGYDVSDYDGVHPDYGAEADFDRLLSEACARVEGADGRSVGAHLRRACVVSRQSQARREVGLVYLAGSEAGRHGAEQLAVGFRRTGLGVPADAAAVLPPQIPAPAASSTGATARRKRRACGARPASSRAASTAFASTSPTPISTTRH